MSCIVCSRVAPTVPDPVAIAVYELDLRVEFQRRSDRRDCSGDGYVSCIVPTVTSRIVHYRFACAPDFVLIIGCIHKFDLGVARENSPIGDAPYNRDVARIEYSIASRIIGYMLHESRIVHVGVKAFEDAVLSVGHVWIVEIPVRPVS